jgi:hypothetical protein
LWIFYENRIVDAFVEHGSQAASPEGFRALRQALP